MMEIKNLGKVSDASRNAPVSLYVNYLEGAVYTRPRENRRYLTDLIRYNTPEEIEHTVYKFMNY